MSRKNPDPDIYETERWTIRRPSQLFQGWTERIIYSITDRGTYTRLTLYDKDGKEYRYGWTNANLTSEDLEARGFTLTKRRKPKKLSIK